MEQLVALSMTKTKVKRDDDFTDRLSHRYTCIILVIFATIISTKQYVGSPITCWVPTEFTGSHTKYTNSYCWVRNTYYLPFDEYIPKEDEHHKREVITYYQWIPFIFLLQAMFFYLPTIIWHGLNSKAGIDSDNILDAATSLQCTEKVDKREDLLRLITNQIHRFLHSRQEKLAGWKQNMRNCFNMICCACCGKRMSSYLVVLFVISKLFYGLNVIAQLFLLKHIFLHDDATFGLDFAKIMDPSEDGTDIRPNFPRVTFCDFKVRRLGNVHRYTVQCVLPINLYMKFMYTFLWFWMVFIAIATFLSLATWIVRFLHYRDRRLFVINHLEQYDRLQDGSSRELLDEFMGNYLQQDGAFLLRLIAHNTNGITTSEITCAVWDRWLLARMPKMAAVAAEEDHVKPMSNGRRSSISKPPPPWSADITDKRQYMDSPM